MSLTGQKPLGFGYTDASMISDPTPDIRRNRGGVTGTILFVVISPVAFPLNHHSLL
jgi:hypothetical protein